MDGLRFVLEAPPLSRTHKKRPRLVTSCDNWCVARSSLSLVRLLTHSLRFFKHSRLKKFKCIQTKSQPRCEACEAGNTSCQFRDRERYFAERSRIVTGTSAGSSPAHSRRSSSPLSTEPSIPSPTRGDFVDTSGWYSRAQTSSYYDHPLRYDDSSPSHSLWPLPLSDPDQWFSSPLVEPARPHYERSASSHSRLYVLRCLTVSDYFVFTRQPSYTSHAPPPSLDLPSPLPPLDRPSQLHARPKETERIIKLKQKWLGGAPLLTLLSLR